MIKKILQPIYIKEKDKLIKSVQRTLEPDNIFFDGGGGKKKKLRNIQLKKLKIKLNKIKNKMKNYTNKKNTKLKYINFEIQKSFILIFILIFSFLFNFNIINAADTTPPTVNITYTSNPTGVGTNTISATYSEPVSTVPTISINQPGTSDIANATMTSPGAEWTARAASSQTSGWRSVVYGNSLFVAVASSGEVMTSPDGITWTSRTPAATNQWYSVTYGNNLFVAVASSGTNRVMTSPDGITWTSRSAAEANQWKSVTYNNNLFVAVAIDGTNRVMTSPDGITWTARAAAEANTWNSVTYGNGIFVAVAYSGTNRVMTSPDGITWTARAASEASGWNSVTYGNDLFIAVADSGTNRVMTSPDGITWTSRSAAEANQWRSVSYSGNIFVATSVDGTNRVMTSLNGITWAARSAAEANNWVYVTYGNGLFVAVAYGGSGSNRVMTSIANSFYYNYTVNQANGSTYVDGTATVSLSSVTDIAGNTAEAPTNNTFAIDTTGPTVALTYSANPAKAGTNTITATYSEAVTTAPYISINQPGSTDISNVQMSGSGTTYTYNYTVNSANGSTYIDGEARISLSTVVNASGKPSSIPTNSFFIIDTTAPVLTYSYSSNPVKAGTQTITATYSEAISGTPTISIDQPGSVDISGDSLTNYSGASWTQRSMASTSGWESIVYGNNIFVAVSQHGTINTSPDGITWTARTAAEANQWRSVTYGNGLFVAVASNGTNRVMTSPDGITWTARAASEANTWNSVTYGNGLFVAVSSSGTNRVMTSPDGITWTARTPEANMWYEVTYGNGLFVAVGSSFASNYTVTTSPDGITWTGRTPAAVNIWTSITYGNGLFVAVSSSGTNRVMTSPDGITWTARSASEQNQWQSVAYGNGLYIAVADSGTNRVMTSPDGITWTARYTGGTQALYSITYGKGLFCGVGTFVEITAPASSFSYNYTVNQANGSTYIDGNATVSLSSVTDLAGNALATPTGNTFSIDTTPANVAITYTRNPANVGVNKIQATYSEGLSSNPTISVNQQGSTDITNVPMVSPANTWTARTAAEANTWTSVTYGNGLFVAVANSGTNRVMTSPDGITWTARTTPTSNTWTSVTYGNGLFVAVANNSGNPGGHRVMTSPDGITWTARAAAEANTWLSVTYGNGLFVAVADSGTNRVMTSPDGITWTAIPTPGESNTWKSVAYGNGLFVVNSLMRVMTSPDGITWTGRSISVLLGSSVVYGNGLFLGVETLGCTSSKSTDGITWTTAGNSQCAQSVTYSNGLFVAVGNNKIVTSIGDGNWSTKTVPEANNWVSVVYGNGIFVAVSAGGTNRVMTSPGGYTYDYTVNAQSPNGDAYLDGEATVSLSATTDLAGNATNSPTGNTFIINTQPTTVALTYSKNPAGVGTNTITATYSRAVVGTPHISIDQPGSTDISSVAMTGSGTVFTYDYAVNRANGSTYIDGIATVSLSSMTDVDGGTSSAPTNTTFTIDTVRPTADITYSIEHQVKTGDSLVITATLSEPMADAPIPQISISGSNTLDLTNMTKVDTTHYTYTHSVGAGNGVATIFLNTGTDVAGNVITNAPLSGATFTVDNTLPTGNITAICSVEGNGCTVSGESATPQKAYTVQSISGTASDDLGLSAVSVSIKNTNTNKWYNGTSFSEDSEMYLSATGTTVWSFDSSSMPLTIGHVYLINVKPVDVAGNNQVINLSFEFTNSPPVVSNLVASEDSTGVVNVTYDVTDIESSQTTNFLFYKTGIVLDGNLESDSTSLNVSDATLLSSSGTLMIDEEIILYSSKTGNTLNGLTRGALNTISFSHTSNADIFALASSATGDGIGLSNKGTGKTITWLARSDINGYESANGIIKVVANDGSAGSMIGELESAPFILDAKAPTSVVTFDAGIAGEEDSGVITIPKPTDVGLVEYKISDDAETQTNPLDTGWVSISENTTIPWTFDSDVEAKSIKYQFRDSFGNISTETTTSTKTPVPSSSFIVQDTSNISAVPPYYDMYIGWQATSSEEFSSYKLEYSTSSDNISYSAYSTIQDSGMSTYSTNYYIHRNLNSSLYYKYRLGVVDVNGNTSVRSNASITAKPDGVQNFGEGGGGSVATAPKVENVIALQNADKTISITYKLTDTSLSKKVNPSYEEYVFYNIGLTLPSNAFSSGSLTISDASKIKSSGYVLINNEVVGYTNKNGNILSGLSRGTWPNSSRATRTNTNFFAGTPVWVLASSTNPVNISNTDISTGQNETITWNTFEELTLAGNVFSNVGIKVLVHDNQDALSGPISNQNDYSEDGILNTLDLATPAISFAQTSSAGSENISPVTATLNLSHRYPYNTAVSYTLSGTANSSDYTLSNGTITFNAGDTSADLYIPIVSDVLKEEDETIILTLSSPLNGTLGSDIVYTYTITDDDNLSGIQFAEIESSGLESITSVNIPVTLSEISGAETTVNYTISGTATQGEDYTLSNGSINIATGETNANITIPIINDILKEEDETIILTLSNPNNATLGSNTVYTYTITDDDLLPTLGFDSVADEGSENVNTVDIPVSISATYAEDVTFSYAVTGGLAENDSIDYLLNEGTKTISAGETTTNISLVVFDDEISEDTETVLITISNPVNANLGTNTTFAYSILDNEIAVTDVSGSSIKSTSARITWTTADFTDSLIEYGTIAPGMEGSYNLSKISTEKVLEHNVYLGNLIPSTKYYFKTTSTNLANEVTVSESDFTTTPGPVISNTSIGSVTDTGATITWTTDIPANSYITYSTDPDLLSPVVFGSADLVTEHSVVLAGLNSDATYYFLVSSTDESNNTGEDANGGSFYTLTTGADATPPVISNIDTPIVTPTQVAIVWKTNELADGKIQYGTNSGSYDNETELISTPMTEHMATISGLDKKTEYYYVIESADSNGNAAISEEKTFTTPEADQVVISSGGGGVIGVAQQLYDILLAENQLYKSKIGNMNSDLPIISEIEISEISAFSAIVSFNTSEDTISFIEYGKDKKYGLVATSKTWSRNHKIKLTGLSMGTDYYFKISAMDRTNDTGYSEEKTFKTKFFSENLAELTKIENIEQFQAEIESTIESILPSLVPPFIDKPVISDITENSAKITFKTNIKAYPIVSYTTDAYYDNKKENPYDGEISDTTEKNIIHTLQITGLKSNTKYHIMAKAFSLPQVVGKGEDLIFTTKASKIRATVIEKKNDSFTVVWTTDEPTSSIVEYKNIKNGKSGRITDETKNTSHSIKVENLTPGSTYEVNVSGVNSIGNIAEGAETINVTTSTDATPPIISNFKVDSALVVGRTDKTQTIVSWQTDEPANSIVSFEEGSGSGNKELSNKKEDMELTINHVAILTTLKPGTVYRFQIASVDNAGNITKLPVRTIITPRPNESIVDVIFKNFDETFNFIKNVR